MTDNATTFEDIEDFKMTDLDGSSQQVLTDAFMMDAGAALTEADLFTAGSYPIVQEQGMFTIYAKKVNNNTIELRTVVEDWAIEAAKKDLAHEKAVYEKAIETKTEGVICKYCVPAWIQAELMFRFGVSPEIDILDYERTLWREYPHLWVDTRKAPRLM